MTGSGIILHGDSLELRSVLGAAGIYEPVACVVTSPPYNTGQPYPGVPDVVPLAVHLDRIRGWSREISKVMMWGGRVWVNVPPALPIVVGEQPRWSPLHAWFKELLGAGLSYRDTVVWFQNDAHQATAWGSWMSPNAPNLRGRWEALLLFSRGPWSRGVKHSLEADGVTSEEFTEWAQNVWSFPPARRVKDGHPCPFPGELARRAVLLSTAPGELVLDPFAGSGTTVRVAQGLGRRGVGVDLSAEYAGEAA